jgi:hypothetical protein
MILIVDSITTRYSHLTYYPIEFTASKDDVYKKLRVNSYDILFINTLFNEDFVNKIRNIDPYVPIYLINLTNDGKCMVEYAALIDGYLISVDQVEQKIERLVSKKQYVHA